MTGRVADHAKRKQGKSLLGADARNEFGLHVRRRRACRLRDFDSLLAGIDHRRNGQKVGDMDWQS